MTALEPEVQEKTKKEFLTPNDNSHFFKIGADFLKKKISNYALSHIIFTTTIALDITNFFIFRCRN